MRVEDVETVEGVEAVEGVEIVEGVEGEGQQDDAGRRRGERSTEGRCAVRLEVEHFGLRNAG